MQSTGDGGARDTRGARATRRGRRWACTALAAAAGAATLAATLGAGGAGPALGQQLAACPGNDAGKVDADTPLAWTRTGTVTVVALNDRSRAGTLTIAARDPAYPISHPASYPVSSLHLSSLGEASVHLRVERGDGDAVAALTWLDNQNGVNCAAQVSRTISVGAGQRPTARLDKAANTRRALFSFDQPECIHRAVTPVVVDVRGPGGAVRASSRDTCTQRFRVTGRNPHFQLRGLLGVAELTGRSRPLEKHNYPYRVRVGGRLVLYGHLRISALPGRVLVVAHTPSGPDAP